MTVLLFFPLWTFLLSSAPEEFICVRVCVWACSCACMSDIEMEKGEANDGSVSARAFTHVHPPEVDYHGVNYN